MFKSKIKFISLGIILTIMLTFLSCAKTQIPEGAKQNKIQYPLTITDSYNRTVTIDKKPERIISLAPNITEIISELNGMNRLVGRTDYCDYPENVKSIESVGNLTEPNIEKIAALKPDVVIASTHFKKEVLEKLEQLNIKVVVLYGPESFDGVYDVIKKVGDVIGEPELAERVIVEMKKKVDDVVNKVKEAKEKPKVYYVISYGKFGDYTAGEGTFIDNMIEMAGGINIASDVKGWQYSLERIVKNDPDIIICSKYFETKNGIMNTPGYKDLRAVKEGKLIEIDNNLLDRQGPRLAQGLEELAKIIHPELFK